MTKLTKKEFDLITNNLGIAPVRPTQMSPFAAACLDRTVEELSTAYNRPADIVDCAARGISAGEYSRSIEQALAAIAADYADAPTPAPLNAAARRSYVFAALDCDLDAMGPAAYRGVTAAELAQALFDHDGSMPAEIQSAGEIEADVAEWLQQHRENARIAAGEHFAICDRADPDAVLARASNWDGMFEALWPHYREKRHVGVRLVEQDGSWSWLIGSDGQHAPTAADLALGVAA